MYGVLVVTSAALVLTTGGTDSPFVALWMTLSVFAGIFGFYGLLPLFLALMAYLFFNFFINSLGSDAVGVILFAGELPLVISYLIWHSKATEEVSDKRAYQALASELSQVAGKSEVVINAIADGVIALDSQGAIQLINPAAQKIIGWGKQDALTLNYRSVLKLIDSNDTELNAANDPIIKVLATNERLIDNNLKLMTSSGKKILVSVVVSPIGQIGSGVIVVFRDITKERAEEREQAEFISTASHEMRTPVASIEGYLGLALNPATAQIDAKARDYITKAHEASQHLGRLFKDLLDVSRAADGRLSNNPKITDVVAFVQNIALGMMLAAEQKGLRLYFKPQPADSTVEEDYRISDRHISPIFYVNADNDHLREVVSNLIENAIKYTPQGSITVDVTGDKDRVVISITDSGIGIPVEDMPHLFQKFYRVDNSATREIGGTGLGLYLCRRLMEAMNGRIWAESQYKQGSTFFVELPRIDHTEAMRLLEVAAAKAEEKPSEIVSTSEPQLITPSVQQSITQPQPVAPLAPQPTAPPISPTPAITPVYSSNIPLTHIEQNPNAYTRVRAERVIIPPRNQN
jgi:two-component system, OmpR family, sensor histidine kinase VicK